MPRQGRDLNHSMDNFIEVIYTANAGVLVSVKDTHILIDGLCKEERLIYTDTPDDLAHKIIFGAPPFKKIHALLYTHAHPDHFSASMTDALLNNHHETCLIAGKEVLEKLSADSRKAATSLAHLKEIQYPQLSVHPIKTKHINRARDEVEHYAYLVKISGVTIFILGDAEPEVDNFNEVDFSTHSVDLAIAPFPYVSTFRGQRIIRDLIKPKKMIAIHFPSKEKDTYNYRLSSEKMYDRTRARFIPTIFVDHIGNVYKVKI